MKKIKSSKARNFAAMSPLLKKGGVHQESKSGKRRKDKNALKKELNRLAKQGDFFMCNAILIMVLFRLDKRGDL